MKAFLSLSTDVYYHLALESYLIKQTQENYFFLWRSEPCVVIGKHQNPYKEINIPYVFEKEISVARRISGGGTVYHDLENINFTFIKNVDSGKQINFQKHSEPIFNALKELGFDITTSKRNDMRIAGKKFSGNAEHVYKNRVLHHGTLLFNSNLNVLNQVIQAKNSSYEDSSIASVRSTVANLMDYTNKWTDSKSFMQSLFQQIVSSTNNFKLFNLSENIDNEVSKLRSNQFTLDSWIWGYTPQYSFDVMLDYGEESLLLNIFVKKGIIKDICYRKETSEEAQNWLNRHLLGIQHTVPFLTASLSKKYSYNQVVNHFF